MNFKYSYYKFAQKHIRLLSNIPKPKNHYNSLGIPSTSTQHEVKSAYYKLSMIYHPDKNLNNPESSQKFRDINEAYEILGNVNTRKLYDKGFSVRGSVVVDDTANKFHKSTEARTRPPPPSGRTPIYDFDEWSRSHYGATFHRRMESRKKEQMYKQRYEEYKNDEKMEKVLLIFGVILVLCMLKFRTDDYDTVSYISGIPLMKEAKNDIKKD